MKQYKFPTKDMVFKAKPSKKTFKTVGANLEQEEYDKVQAFAQANNTTVNQLIKTLLIEFVNANTKDGE